MNNWIIENRIWKLKIENWKHITEDRKWKLRIIQGSFSIPHFEKAGRYELCLRGKKLSIQISSAKFLPCDNLQSYVS